uniref:VWFD domain-containing protein n=1 Tax=Cyprinus carpio TaxID=7962 RepID=A0A8C1UHN6_CYPCA
LPLQRMRTHHSPCMFFHIHSAGIYVVTEVKGLLNLIWDNKTSLMLQLDPKFKGKVCGLCGNFDGNAKNDFMKHNGEVVTDPEDFGNSWKVNPDCPDVTNMINVCKENPHRRVWAVKQCSIITTDVFKDCHALVDFGPYYDACVRDTCTCDSGGDCDCLCTAVAAYATECRKKKVCVEWRSQKMCPWSDLSVTLHFKVPLLHILHALIIIITIMHNYMQVTISQTLILTLTI